MTDKREIILTRILAALAAIPGVQTTWRNRGELPEDKRPAVVLLDGTESSRTDTFDRGRIKASVNIITMLPQVFLLLKPRDTPKNEGVGEELSDYRTKIIKAICSDSELVNYVGPNGQIEYRGCDTDMQTGSTLSGEMQLHFAFRYVLNPDQL